MTALTPERLAELDALHAAMTPGEWVAIGTSVVDWDHDNKTFTMEFMQNRFNVKQTDDARGIVALHNDYPALSAALRAAWAERDQWRTYAHDVEGVTQSIAEIMTGEPDTSGIVHRVKEIRAERDRLAERLAEAEEFLRPFSEWYAKWGEEIATEAKSAYRAAAAFIASTEPAK